MRGVPTTLVARVAGHESYQTSMRYMGKRSKDLIQVLDVFEDEPSNSRSSDLVEILGAVQEMG